MATPTIQDEIFTVEWDLEEPRGLDRFVRDSRLKIEEKSPRKWRKKPVVYEVEGEVKWWTVILKTARKRLKIKLRFADLFAMGFYANNKWYVFKRTSHFPELQHNVLDLSSDYGKLVGALEKEHICNINDLPMSIMKLKNAVDSLADYSGLMSRAELAQHLLIVIVFTCETIRFNTIFRKACRILQTGLESTFTLDEAELIRKWSNICTAMIKDDFRHVESTGICSIKDGLFEIGVMLKETKVAVDELDKNDGDDEEGWGGGNGGDGSGGLGGGADGNRGAIDGDCRKDGGRHHRGTCDKGGGQYNSHSSSHSRKKYYGSVQSNTHLLIKPSKEPTAAVKMPISIAANGSKNDYSCDSSSSEDDSSSGDETPKMRAAQVKKPIPVATNGSKKDSSSDKTGAMGNICTLTMSVDCKIPAKLASVAMTLHIAGLATYDVTIDAMMTAKCTTRPSLTFDMQSMGSLCECIGLPAGYFISGFRFQDMESQGPAPKPATTVERPMPVAANGSKNDYSYGSSSSEDDISSDDGILKKRAAQVKKPMPVALNGSRRILAATGLENRFLPFLKR